MIKIVYSLAYFIFNLCSKVQSEEFSDIHPGQIYGFQIVKKKKRKMIEWLKTFENPAILNKSHSHSMWSNDTVSLLPRLDMRHIFHCNTSTEKSVVK